MLIVAGGFQAGRAWAAAAPRVLLALGFLGLAHALIETTVGKPHRRDRDAGAGPARRRRPHRPSRSSLLLALTARRALAARTATSSTRSRKGIA